ncbi:MAG: LysM peptidoglycan-binding domain-containing protein, partial [Oscillospiraceae bacterium]
ANNVEINCEGILSSIVFYTQTKRILVSAEIFDLEKLDNSGKIVVYYSEKGEELWGIGRQYHTSVASIIENNNLAENNLSPGGALAVF